MARLQPYSTASCAYQARASVWNRVEQSLDMPPGQIGSSLLPKIRLRGLSIDRQGSLDLRRGDALLEVAEQLPIALGDSGAHWRMLLSHRLFPSPDLTAGLNSK